MNAEHAYIDLEKYPIHQPENPAFTTLLKQVQSKLAEDGCAVLKGSLSPAGIEATRREADEQSKNAFGSEDKTNAYFGLDDPALPLSHPVRQFYKRSNAFIPADNFSL